MFFSPPDKTNKESVRAIQKSIFAVCLDAPLPRVSDELYLSRVTAQMLHGGGARWNSGNRWFDKTLQVCLWHLRWHMKYLAGLWYCGRTWIYFKMILSSLLGKTVHVDWFMNMLPLRVHPLCFSSITLLNTCKFWSNLDKCFLCFKIEMVSHFFNRQNIQMVRSPMVPLPMPQKLRFNITPEIKRDIENAKQNMNMCVKWSVLIIFSF